MVGFKLWYEKQYISISDDVAEGSIKLVEAVMKSGRGVNEIMAFLNM